jgi:hypothetical protein
MAMVLRWWSPSLVAAALVLGASIPAAAPGGGWPVPNWTTVPTYTFCGPGKRLFNEAELAFISGKSSAGYAPRWMALGYSTLAQYPPVQQASCAKQTEVARHIKAVAPHMPVWAGTDWDLLLCDTPTNLAHKNATCQMEFDAEMRADPEQLLHCGGELVIRNAAQGRAIHNWANNGTRRAYAGAHRAWRDSGAVDGVFWDGLQHRFYRSNDPTQDYPTADGHTTAKCSPDDILSFHAGEVQMVKDGRDAIGWENVTICNDGRGLGNWTFAQNDSDASRAGRPMCSGSNFEFYQGLPMDVLGIHKMAQWSEKSGQRYLAAIRGLPGKVRKGAFAPFIYKTIILPRQARDKHRENSKKARFLEGAFCAAPGWVLGGRRSRPLLSGIWHL